MEVCDNSKLLGLARVRVHLLTVPGINITQQQKVLK